MFFNNILLRLSEIVEPEFENVRSHGTEVDGTLHRDNIISNKFGYMFFLFFHQLRGSECLLNNDSFK